MNALQTDEPVIARFFAHLRSRGCSHNTLLAYRTGLRDLVTTIRRPLLGLIPEDLDHWTADVTGRVGQSTARSYITGIRAFYTWAVTNEWIPKNPTLRIVPPRSPRRLPRPLPDDDVELAIATATVEVAAAIGLERYAGLRCAEVAGLDWAEVSLGGDAHLRVVSGKGRHERVVDIAPRLEALLLALPGRRGPVIPRRDGRREPNKPWRISQLINKHLDACGIDGTAHQLRHSCGTAVYRVTRDIRATAEVLGHASMTTSALYAKASRADVRRAVLDAAELRVS